MEIIAVAIQKGGTGKTTTAAALVQAAAHKGRSCLAIDLDPQGNLSYTLATDTGKPGSFDLLEGTPPAALIQHKAGFDIIPASWNLSTVTSGKGSARRLQKAIAPLKGKYDLIVIDTPPTAGELQYNALQASTGLIIPLEADIYNLQSLYQITDTARQIQPYLGAIRAAVAVKEAEALQRSLFEYAPKSKPAADYMEIYNAITGQEG